MCTRLLQAENSLYNFYGPTETTVWSAFHHFRSPDEPVVVGRPLANTQIYILDKNLQPLPIGVPGEIHIGGEGVTRGYLNRPELTEEKFIPNPFSHSVNALLYKTGDMGRFLPDGRIEFQGRADFQVKIRGFRIELGEIESVLSHHPNVERVVVIVREDRPGDKKLVAYVILKPDQDLVLSELRAHLEQSLPEYMVPSMFVRMQSFPVTANGKIERRALPAPDWSHLAAANKNTPSDHLELILVRVWENVLGIPNLGVDDNFFDLGGHSLLAVRLLSEVEKVVRRRIPLASLFRGPTVASLAKLIREGSESDPEPLVVEFQAGNREFCPFFTVAAPGLRTLGYALLARHMGEDQPFYKLQAQDPIAKEHPLTSNELRSLAHQYVAGMRVIQPRGPYFLAAMCVGVQIAEQMILQLESQGQEVSLFAIFDTWAVENSHRRWRWQLFNYHQRLRWLRTASLLEQVDWIKRAFGNLIRILTGKAKPSRPWVEAYWPHNFAAPRFSAPVVLFKRPKQPYYYVDDPQMGWGARSEGGVELHQINVADHLQLLREPNVQMISKKLAARLRLVRRP